jgi:hypothetical protein
MKISHRAHRGTEKNLCELCASVRNFHALFVRRSWGVTLAQKDYSGA